MARSVWHVIRPAEGGLLTYLRGLLSAPIWRELEPVVVGPISLGLPGVREIVCRLPGGLDPARDARVLVELRRAAGHAPPSLIHCHGAKAALLSRLAFPARLPLVYAIHRPPAPGVSDVVERLLASRVSAFLAPSQSVKDEVMRRWRVNGTRLRLAPVGLPSDRKHQLLALKRPRQGGRVRVGVVSRLMGDKGIDVLLNACHRVATSSAVWSGQLTLPVLEIAGDGPLRLELERQAHYLGLGRWVRFIGRLSADEVPPFLSRCHVFVLPSRREAFGLAATESLAAGCATIVSDAVGMAAFLRHGSDSLIFPSGDSGALAAELLRLIACRNLRQRVSAVGRATAARLPTAEDHAADLLRLYGELIGSADAD